MFIFIEAPILGKISRTRRAKSAHARNSGKSKLSDKKKLIRESDSSSTDIVDSNEIKMQCPVPVEIKSIASVNSSAAYINPVLEMEEDAL